MVALGTVQANKILFPDATVNSPSLTFQGDITIGLAYDATDDLMLFTNESSTSVAVDDSGTDGFGHINTYKIPATISDIVGDGGTTVTVTTETPHGFTVSGDTFDITGTTSYNVTNATVASVTSAVIFTFTDAVGSNTTNETGTLSNLSAIEIDFGSSYTDYKVKLHDVQSSGADDPLQVQFRNTAGTLLSGTSYRTVHIETGNNGAVTVVNETDQTSGSLTTSVLSAGDGVHGDILIEKPSLANFQNGISWTIAVGTDTDSSQRFDGRAYYNSSSNIRYLRLFFSSTDTDTGEFRAYGYTSLP